MYAHKCIYQYKHKHIFVNIKKYLTAMILQELKQRPLQNNRMRGWHALKRCNELDFEIVNKNVQARQISACATCFVKNPKLDSAAGLWVSFSTLAKFIRIATKSSLIDDDIITCQKLLTLPASV